MQSSPVAFTHSHLVAMIFLLQRISVNGGRKAAPAKGVCNFPGSCLLAVLQHITERPDPGPFQQAYVKGRCSEWDFRAKREHDILRIASTPVSWY